MSTQPLGLGSPPVHLAWPRLAPQTDRRRVSRSSWRALLGRCLLNVATPTWMAVDLFIVCAGTLIGQRAFVWWHPQTSVLIDYKLWLVNVALGCSVVLAGMMFGLYERNTLWHRGRIVARGMLTITFAMVATFICVDVFMYSEISRRTAAFAIIFYLAGATGVRLLAHRAVRHVQHGLLVVGHGATTSLLLRAIQHGRLPGYRLHGIVSRAEDRQGKSIRGIPVLGGPESLPQLVADHRIHEVILADCTQHQIDYQHAALLCLRLGCRVTTETTFYETAFGEAPVAHITPGWFFSADLRGQREEHATIKRVFDLCCAMIGLGLTLPLWPLIALAIRVQDGGPAFYSQKRAGQGGRVFTLHKFRTMRANAETNGCVWAVDNDPRITPLGRWLRLTRLDELPQLWNILRGEMSMVGPRPERPDVIELLSALIPYYQERHLIKPGLTGWAQINYHYGSSVADARRKLQYDLYYIKHISLELDLIILLRTFGTFLLGSR